MKLIVDELPKKSHQCIFEGAMYQCSIDEHDCDLNEEGCRFMLPITTSDTDSNDKGFGVIGSESGKPI